VKDRSSSRHRLVDLLDLVNFYFWRVWLQMFVHEVSFVPVLPTYMSLPVCLAFATLWTERTLELRLFTALPLHMALQRVLPHIWTATSRAAELARWFLADVIAGFWYLQFSKWYQGLFVYFPGLHRQIRALLYRIHLLSTSHTWKW